MTRKSDQVGGGPVPPHWNQIINGTLEFGPGILVHGDCVRRERHWVIQKKKKEAWLGVTRDGSVGLYLLERLGELALVHF